MIIENSPKTCDLITRRPTMEMPYIVDQIGFVITCLYKLPLRSPAPLDRFVNQTVPDMSIYQHFDTLYVRDKFPLADPGLGERFGKLVTRRRVLLLSRAVRDKRLTLADEESSPTTQGRSLPNAPEVRVVNFTNLPDTARTTPEIASQSHASDGWGTVMTKATVLRQESGSENVASQSLEPAISQYVPSLASSYATKFRVEVPDRPRGNDGEELDDFKCPYCFIICHVGTRDLWK